MTTEKIVNNVVYSVNLLFDKNIHIFVISNQPIGRAIRNQLNHMCKHRRGHARVDLGT